MDGSRVPPSHGPAARRNPAQRDRATYELHLCNSTLAQMLVRRRRLAVRTASSPPHILGVVLRDILALSPNHRSDRSLASTSVTRRARLIARSASSGPRPADLRLLEADLATFPQVSAL